MGMAELRESPGEEGIQLSTDGQTEPLALLVDSDPSAVEFMARALSQAGLGVLISDRISGPVGASALLRSNPAINVVVLDPQTVPGRDSLQDLQSSGLRDDVQVILVAGPVTLARYTQSAQAEIADFLPKPVARRTLLRAVLEAQRRHALLQEPLLQDGRLARLVERAVTQQPRRAPGSRAVARGVDRTRCHLEHAERAAARQTCPTSHLGDQPLPGLEKPRHDDAAAHRSAAGNRVCHLHPGPQGPSTQVHRTHRAG